MTQFNKGYENSLAWVAEANYNEGADGAKMQYLCYESVDPNVNVDDQFTGERCGERKDGKQYRLDANAGLTITMLLRYGVQDDFIRRCIGSAAWSSVVAVLTAGSVSSVATGNKLTHLSAWDNTPVAGTFVKQSGLSTSGNNGVGKVGSGVDGTNLPELGIVLTDEGPTAGVTIVGGSQVVDGDSVNDETICFEWSPLGLASDVFFQYNGQTIKSLQFSVTAKGFIRVVMVTIGSFIAKDTVTMGDGSPTAVSTNKPLIAGESIVKVSLAGVITRISSDFTMTIDNGAYLRDDFIDQRGPGDESGQGTVMVDGSFSTRFKDVVQVDQFLDFDDVPLFVNFIDEDSNQLIIDLPSTKFNEGIPISPEKKADDMVPVTFSAQDHETENAKVRSVIFPA